MPTISITVKGKVQGVWYRASTQRKAQELGVLGTVQNQKDGSVYIEAQGSAEQLTSLKDWCSIGPPHAEVSEIACAKIPNKTFTGFSIIR